MIDSPSIVSDLAAMIELVEQLVDAEIEGDIEASQKAHAIYKRVPTLRHFVHAHAVGIKHSQRQRKAAQSKKSTLPRDVAMAREFIKRQAERDRLGTGVSDSELMKRIGRTQTPKSLGRSAAIAAIKRGLEHLEGR